MKHHNLPIEDLKTYGIINNDLTFSKKLSGEDIQKFLNGYTIVADNDRNRATFQLTENNTQLKVIFLERDKSLSDILRSSRKKVQYTDIRNPSTSSRNLGIEKKAFIFDKENGKVVEFDFIRNATELTAIIADQKDLKELNRYRAELQKLKNYLYEKIYQYPEIAKVIENDMNIVSRELDSLKRVSVDDKRMHKTNDFDSMPNTIPSSRYEDTNLLQEDEKQYQEESRKFRR